VFAAKKGETQLWPWNPAPLTEAEAAALRAAPKNKAPELPREPLKSEKKKWNGGDMSKPAELNERMTEAKKKELLLRLERQRRRAEPLQQIDPALRESEAFEVCVSTLAALKPKQRNDTLDHLNSMFREARG